MAKQPVYDPAKVFISSDWHLGHTNVIKYDNRPFKTIEEHDEAIIQNIKNTVPEDGLLFFLGDLTFGDAKKAIHYLERIERKMFFIRGNHDYFIEKLNQSQKDKYFHWVKDMASIRIKDESLKEGYQRVVLCHYPIMSWNHMYHGSWHLHGHCHHNLIPHISTKDIEDLVVQPGFKPKDLVKLVFEAKSKQKRLDMGCNKFEYTPLSWKEVKELMDRQIFTPVDHHTEETN